MGQRAWWVPGTAFVGKSAWTQGAAVGRYHANPHCQELLTRDGLRTVRPEEARERGYRPCARCVPGAAVEGDEAR